jgi:flagellar biosynthesis protein FlhB
MSDDRTERPTSRRLKDAKKRGQVASSKDLGSAFSFVAAVMTLAWMGSSMVQALTHQMTRSLARMARSPLVTLDAKEVAGLVLDGGWTLATVVGPLALATIVATVAIQGAQGGWVLTTQPLSPDFGRLSPMTGLRRLGAQGGLELLKAIIIATTLSIVCYQVVKSVVATSPALSRVSAVTAGSMAWNDAMTLMRRCAVALVVFAAADYGLQKWRFIRSHRMTKQEVREDHKLTDGNPEIKGRVRRIQMDLFRRRMFASVPKATLVVTNPTHFAVALEYHRGTMSAPKVVAKGQNLIAQRIKAIAREHGVPVVENPPLARALYKSVEVGDFIPAALFEAVAEVLAYLIRLRQLVL